MKRAEERGRERDLVTICYRIPRGFASQIREANPKLHIPIKLVERNSGISKEVRLKKREGSAREVMRKSLQKALRDSERSLGLKTFWGREGKPSDVTRKYAS